MTEHKITSANDVELFLEPVGGGTQRGTSPAKGRIVVDDFSITKDDGSELVHGVGLEGLPGGIAEGTVDHGFSFTLMGQDLPVFDMVADSQGKSKYFNFTAQKPGPNGNEVEWSFSVEYARATSEEISASSGDANEYAVEGIAYRVDKTSDTNSDVWSG